MKDEFDDVTPDMFEGVREKKVSKPVFDRAEPYLKKAVEKIDKSLGITKETSPELQKSFAEKLSKVSKPIVSGGAGGAGGETGFGIQKMNKNLNRTYKKGGKVSSASSRADGCVTKGRTKGRFV